MMCVIVGVVTEGLLLDHRQCLIELYHKTLVSRIVVVVNNLCIERIIAAIKCYRSFVTLITIVEYLVVGWGVRIESERCHRFNHIALNLNALGGVHSEYTTIGVGSLES